MEYVKLKDLVGKTFTVESVEGYNWQMWLAGEGRMHISDTYQEGHRKTWKLKTNKGTLSLGAGQMGNVLEAIHNKGVSDLIGKTISVKSNGKTGVDIRYFFNQAKEEPKEESHDDINLDDIGF